MRVLVVYCNPNPESLGAHIRDTVVTALSHHEVEVIDLYAEAFDPVMCRQERAGYHTPGDNEVPVAAHLERLRWAEGIIFIYPTWWFGLPAMLKGWLDRVLIPYATFELPTKTSPIRGKLHNIRTVVAITTCGARFWQSKVIGEPGRKTLLRALRYICHPRCATRYAALYRIDTSTPRDRARFIKRVETLVAAL